MGPREIATQHTVDFLLPILDEKQLCILEVGCGAGDVAKRLVELGHRVIAVEPSVEGFQITKQKGVDVRQTDFLEFSDEQQFDIICFTRSLHHIHPLSAALQIAIDHLKPSGTLIIEDFAVENAELKTALWFYGLQSILSTHKLLEGEQPITLPSDPIKRWRKDHKETPPLTEGKTIIDEVTSLFEVVTCSETTYLYRYFIPELTERGDANNAIQSIFQWETNLIQAGQIQPLGLRIVAKRPI